MTASLPGRSSGPAAVRCVQLTETVATKLSEGLATGSYLDTGNRDRFTDADAAVIIRHDPRMAAPLAVARDIVEPIWQQVTARAELLGLYEPGRSTYFPAPPRRPTCSDCSLMIGASSVLPSIGSVSGSDSAIM